MKWWIVFSFIYLATVSYFVWEDLDPTRPDTARYQKLAKSICDKSRFYANNPRGEQERLLAEQQNLSGRAALAPLQAEVFRTPGYPLFLCLQDKVGITEPGGKVLVNLFFWFAAMGLLVYFFVPQRAHDEGAWLGISIYASIGGLVYILTLYSEVLFVFFLIPAYGFAYRYLSAPRMRWLVFSALAFAAAFYVRASALYLPLLLVLVFGVVLWRRHQLAIRRLDLLAFLLIFAVALSPWLLRNQHHYGTPYVSAQMSNMLAYWHVPVLENRLLGTAEEASRLHMHERVAEAVAAAEAERGHYLNTVEYFQVQQDLAVRELLSTPWEYAGYWLKGFWYTLSHGHFTQLYAQFSGQAWPPRDTVSGVLVRIIVKAERLFWLSVAALALLGGLRALRQNEGFILLAVLTALYFMWIPGLMGYPRFRFPAEWLWLLAAGYGLAWLRSGFDGRFDVRRLQSGS